MQAIRSKPHPTERSFGSSGGSDRARRPSHDWLDDAPPLSLYVHIPWCVRKCPYCDFNSYRAAEELPEREYVEALLRELDADLPYVQGRVVQSIFFGGGTPSLFSGAGIRSLMEGFRSRLRLAAEVEVTLEANPGAAEQGRFHEYREAGCNRLSIGIQSFDDTMLERLGRVHGRAEALAAVGAACLAGFENINLDLMWGLPGQGPGQAQADLVTALGLGSGHLSYYQLTIEPGTPFYLCSPVLPNEDLLWEAQLRAETLLANRGYTQYEVSAFCREGKHCRHNLNYWEFGDYLGLGAGAHGKVTRMVDGTVWRYENIRRPRQYMAGLRAGRRIRNWRWVSPRDRVFEFLLNGLRLTGGVDIGLLEHRTGVSREIVGAELAQAHADGLLEPLGQRIRATSLGLRFLNEVVARFLPCAGDSK